MKVRATQLGYYGHRRRNEGDEFELEPIKRMRKDKDGNMREITIMPEQQFSHRWMERVEENSKPKVKRTTKKSQKEDPVVESEPTDGI